MTFKPEYLREQAQKADELAEFLRLWDGLNSDLAVHLQRKARNWRHRAEDIDNAEKS